MGGTRPSGPCGLSPGPGEDTAPHPLATLRLGPLSLWPRLAFLALRIPRKGPGVPVHPDQRRLSWAHLCPPRPPPSGSQASSWGLRGGPPPLAGIGDTPSGGPSTDMGSPWGPRTGPSALSAPQRTSVRWTLPVREGVGLRRLQAQAAAQWNSRRQLSWVLTPPAAPARFQSIRWPQEQGLRLEPQGLTRPEAADSGGSQSPTGGDGGDQARHTLPAGGADHVTGSRAPELQRPPGPSLSCDHVPPLDRVPSAGPFQWPLGGEGRKGQLSCSGHSLGRLCQQRRPVSSPFLPFVLAAPWDWAWAWTKLGPSLCRTARGDPRFKGTRCAHPTHRGLTLVSPWPHLCFTGTHILEAKATCEERLDGSRSRTP